ncbi:MAG TPA: DUF3159 domain-containing protein [Micromonosporaceae bacterium]
MTDQAQTADRDGSVEPSFSEQLAEQLGGVRGLTESSIPVLVFVVVNVIWSLNPALIGSVAVALGIVAFRAAQREPIRHAVNGLFGVGIGAVIAWRTGDAKNYYLPGILMSFLYGALLMLSAAARHPAIGYVWAVIAAGGKHTWRHRARLLRTFQWLTVLWAATFLLKGVVQGWLWLVNEPTLLGIARLSMGYPPYLLLLGVTVWAVRRAMDADPAGVEPVAGPQSADQDPRGAEAAS